jgi:MoaA/NifB/PqqE/SkfB family radical SAM enzyme
MDPGPLMTGLGPVPLPVLQVHASRVCNLACLHCYSVSGPDAPGALDPEHVCRVVSDAATLGYRVLAFSGGEPLAYNGITEVLRHARNLGLRTSVTTNGTLSTERHLRLIADLVDVVAVSVDGPVDLHNRIRGNDTAFARTSAGLARFRETGAALGIIHTLTRESLPHLEWLADFAVASGAVLLQVHPLELFGRGQTTMGADAADAEVLARAYVAGFALRRLYAASLAVQFDISHRDHLRAIPESIYASDVRLTGAEAAADLLGVIVLEQDGLVAPVAYGFGRRFRVCNSREQDLKTAWDSYVGTGYLEFRMLCRKAWEALAEPQTPTLLNWHDLIVARSVADAPV